LLSPTSSSFLNMKLIVAALAAATATAFVPAGRVSSPSTALNALAEGETPIVIGLAADSGCGKSTFMRRVTSTFGGDKCGPLGGGFGAPGGWETNTLVSDMATVICLDD